MPFADIHELKDLDRLRFPHADWFEYKSIKAQAKKLHDAGYIVCTGTAGDMDFINGISHAKGMEQVLMDMIDDNEVFLEIMVCRQQPGHLIEIVFHNRILSTFPLKPTGLLNTLRLKVTGFPQALFFNLLVFRNSLFVPPIRPIVDIPHHHNGQRYQCWY